jgi:hypothetical protein
MQPIQRTLQAISKILWPKEALVQLVETVPAELSPSGNQTVSLVANGDLRSDPSIITQQIASWKSGNPRQARSVRVQLAPIRDNSYEQFGTYTPPLIGAMACVVSTSQQGSITKTWKAVPADFVVSAQQIQVYVVGVGLPYQGIPQATPGNYGNPQQTANVQCSISEQLSDPEPSQSLYPGPTFVTGAPSAYLGPQCPPGGIGPMFPVKAALANLSCAGFLRGLSVTNTGASTVYAGMVDLPASVAQTAVPPTPYNAWAFGSFVPFACPPGATTTMRWDDRPFFWGPWIAIFTALGSSAAFLTGSGVNSVFIEADFVVLQPPGI